MGCIYGKSEKIEKNTHHVTFQQIPSYSTQTRNEKTD